MCKGSVENMTSPLNNKRFRVTTHRFSLQYFPPSEIVQRYWIKFVPYARIEKYSSDCATWYTTSIQLWNISKHLYYSVDGRLGLCTTLRNCAMPLFFSSTLPDWNFKPARQYQDNKVFQTLSLNKRYSCHREFHYLKIYTVRQVHVCKGVNGKK